MAAVAQAVGGAGGGSVTIVGGLLAAFFGWGVWSGVTYLIGDRLLGGTATWGELLRALGFAQAPALLMVLAVVPLLGRMVHLVVGLWVLVAGFIGLRQALDLGNLKTFVTAFLGWLALAIPMALLGGLFGT
jgi:hypothetical protein